MKLIVEYLIIFNFLLIISGCSVFENEQNFCKDLVITAEDSPDAIGVLGDPSNQWVITGIHDNLLKSRGDLLSLNEYSFKPAYPNPARLGISPRFTFSLPSAMSVTIRVKINSNGSIFNLIVNSRFAAGTHSLASNLSDKPKGCYTAEIYFNDSKKRNSFGHILIE